MEKAKGANYVNNRILTAEFTAWKAAHEAAPMNDKPRIPESIGEAIMSISNRLLKKPNFSKYSFKDEMQATAMLTVIRRAHNFDPAKCKVGGAFAWLTTIIINAFLVTIEREQKHAYTRAVLRREQGNKSKPRFSNERIIERYDERIAKKRKSLRTVHAVVIDRELLNGFPPSASVEQFLVKRHYVDNVDLLSLALVLDKPAPEVERLLAAGLNMLQNKPG